MSIGARPEQQAAHPEPADEDREHRGGRGGGGAENQPEIAQPADLVDEGAEAGTEQERGDEPGSCAHALILPRDTGAIADGAVAG